MTLSIQKDGPLEGPDFMRRVKYPQNYLLAKKYKNEQMPGGVSFYDGHYTLVRRIAAAPKPIISYYLKHGKVIGIHIQDISERTELELERILTKLGRKSLRKIEKAKLLNGRICY